jgi:serine/threonine protein kinase
VYAVDAGTVLKVYADPAQLGSLEVLRDFYARLRADDLSFELPLIHEITQEHDLLVVTERRINGTPMTEAQDKGVSGIEDIYLDTAILLNTVRVEPPLDRFMLLSHEYDGAADWHTFITAMIEKKLPDVSAHLSADVANFEHRAGLLLSRFAEPYRGEIRLIHGDIFPGNILMKSPSQVAGVIDFGTLTMPGDPAFDLASACGYYDMYGPENVATRDRLFAAAAARSDGADLESLTAYLLTVALVTCDLYPEQDVAIRDGGHYRWAAQILQDDGYWHLLEGRQRT